MCPGGRGALTPCVSWGWRGLKKNVGPPEDSFWNSPYVHLGFTHECSILAPLECLCSPFCALLDEGFPMKWPLFMGDLGQVIRDYPQHHGIGYLSMSTRDKRADYPRLSSEPWAVIPHRAHTDKKVARCWGSWCKHCPKSTWKFTTSPLRPPTS